MLFQRLVLNILIRVEINYDNLNIRDVQLGSPKATIFFTELNGFFNINIVHRLGKSLEDA